MVWKMQRLTASRELRRAVSKRGDKVDFGRGDYPASFTLVVKGALGREELPAARLNGSLAPRRLVTLLTFGPTSKDPSSARLLLPGTSFPDLGRRGARHVVKETSRCWWRCAEAWHDHVHLPATLVFPASMVNTLRRYARIVVSRRTRWLKRDSVLACARR